jgi:hypothetical protein
MHARFCPSYLGTGASHSDRSIEMFCGRDHMARWYNMPPSANQLRALDTDAVSRNV